jgi:hypothetical protein
MTTAYHEILLATASELERMPKPQKALIARMREAAAMLERAPPERREKIATAMRVLDPRLVSLPEPVTGHRGDGSFRFRAGEPPLSEVYPNASLRDQARIVLGEKPASVTGLTAKEAHAYLSNLSLFAHEDKEETERDLRNLPNRYLSPATWLLDEHRLLRTEVRRDGAAHARVRFDLNRNRVYTVYIELESVPIARWLIDRWRDPAQREALEIYREERGPDGEVVGGRYIERVDELKDEDLRPSVRATFEAATQRLHHELELEAKRSKNQKPLAPEPSWWQPVRCATLLNRPAQFAAEKAELKHCVLTYIPKVRSGKSVVVALRVTDKDGVVHKSTVELDRATMHVLQHRGVKNAPPSKLSEKALDVCLKRWKQKKEGPPAAEARQGNPVTSPGRGRGARQPDLVMSFAEAKDGTLWPVEASPSETTRVPAAGKRKKNTITPEEIGLGLLTLGAFLPIVPPPGPGDILDPLILGALGAGGLAAAGNEPTMTPANCGLRTGRDWSLDGEAKVGTLREGMNGCLFMLMSVPLACLHPTQETVSREKVAKFVKHHHSSGALPLPEISFEASSGRFAIDDGHHRITAARAMRHRNTLAWVAIRSENGAFLAKRRELVRRYGSVKRAFSSVMSSSCVPAVAAPRLESGIETGLP